MTNYRRWILTLRLRRGNGSRIRQTEDNKLYIKDTSVFVTVPGLHRILHGMHHLMSIFPKLGTKLIAIVLISVGTFQNVHKFELYFIISIV